MLNIIWSLRDHNARLGVVLVADRKNSLRLRRRKYPFLIPAQS